jgi:hypothetical protein
MSAVAAHAAQFDDKLPSRPAGSQEEEIASSYLLAHMQTAGYLVRLDGVPVKDQVRSTNVLGAPPDGRPPTIVLAVAYDTPPGGGSDGALLGLWLELARALNVKDPGHSVEFAALGADHAELPGAPLGERRLAQLLSDQQLTPEIVQIVSTDGPVSAAGPLAEEILKLVPRGVTAGNVPGVCSEAACDPLRAAGLAHTYVSGPPGVLAPILLRYLAHAHS